MNTLLNIIWLFLGGLVLALEWVIAGILCIIFIITIPLQEDVLRWQLLVYTVWKKGTVKEQFGEPARPISAFLWIIFAGIWLAISHILIGITQCCTIIGIPFGIQNFKLVQVAFNPYKYTLR